jgi:hypothetical protein
MSPEQARGDADRVDPRSDIFALGAVLYFLLVGKAPFADETVMASLERARNGDFDREALRRAGVPRSLETVCLRAMHAEPDRRYASVEAMADDLERAAAGPRCWRKVFAAIAGTAAVAAVAFGLWNMRGDTPVPPHPIPPVAHSKTEWHSVPPKTEPVDLAMEVLRRPLRHDFPLEFEVVGHTAGPGEKVVMTEGEHATFRVRSEHQCYVGIWLIEMVDGRAKATRLFPNDYELDHCLPAGSARTIPGQSAFTIPVEASKGPEYLHVAAYSQRWDAPSEPGKEPVTPEQLVAWRTNVKAMKVKEGQSPGIAEQLLALDVRPQRQEGDPEAENP